MQRSLKKFIKYSPRKVKVKSVIPKFKKDGTLSKQGLTEEEYERGSALPKNLARAVYRCKSEGGN